MDTPGNNHAKPVLTLRRHSTSPASAGRSVIASVSVGCRAFTRKNTPTSSSHIYRSSMKSNPYVGWFRHSPPTSPRLSVRAGRKSPWYSVPTSLADCKNSPHIGWFRHAPPSRLDLLVPTTKPEPSTKLDLSLKTEENEILWEILKELDTEDVLRCKRLIVGGLPGGGKRSRRKNSGSRPFAKELCDSSAEGTMSTVNALSRLAAWFLFPVAHDAESSGYRPDYPRKSSKKEEGLLNQLSPFLPSFFEDTAVSDAEYAKYGARVDDETDCEGEHDDNSEASDSDSASSSSTSPPVPSKLSCSRDLSLSVSSLAEAYYAHQSTTKDMADMEQSMMTPPVASLAAPISPHRLDYVITQMDIARMSRNAARHLDVQSILSLPVITYQSGSRPDDLPRTVKTDPPYGWSWTIVEGSDGQKEDSKAGGASAATIGKEETDFCVICLEHFVDGERLRVLPCDHFFHVGCIDRWLSGSQSFEECYTSGCPTCKKRPLIDKGRSQSFCEPVSNARCDKHRSGSLDGSVPSWAFAQIGSALVAQQQNELVVSHLDH